MDHFEKLTKAWQDGIDAQINNADGGERPEIAIAFRESYAKHLSEVKIARKPSKADLEVIAESYIDFSTGWIAALARLMENQGAAISSWVREHGELTDYSDLEDNEYEAYIVKKSDLSV